MEKRLKGGRGESREMVRGYCSCPGDRRQQWWTGHRMWSDYGHLPETDQQDSSCGWDRKRGVMGDSMGDGLKWKT